MNLQKRTPSAIAAALLAAAALCGCAGTEGTILPPDVALRPGDVVLRTGRGFVSRAVVMAERDKGYSHVGIVVDSAGCPMVVHAVPGEPDYPGDPDRVKLDAPEAFFALSRATIGEVRRHRDTALARRASEKAMAYYRRRTPFDHDYDNADSTAVYCTELVVRAYREAGLRLADIKPRHFSAPAFNHDCVMPSALALHPAFRRVRFFGAGGE